ncbi:coiled-coil domain-containing protein 3 isoform X2 [Prionailurus viverrinus]|uniref:coiled-coil domain-containing protein 3 isoform X2 n=1 Tax=Prionailurus viverrinus TaxID=61388 RepID=UPI001FF281EC|nr:coiled-coil domain-containing protein 3 isoform X2 [Prionailurus viverrinus]
MEFTCVRIQSMGFKFEIETGRCNPKCIGCLQLNESDTEQLRGTRTWNLTYMSSEMDENYNLLPHGVNFQDAIFPDTQENRRMFSSLFQFSNCSQGQHLATFSSDWEIQEDNRLMCSSVQKALFEEEDHVKKLQQKVATLEKRNKQLRDRVKKVKRSLRQARKNGRHLELVNQKLSEKLAAAAGAVPHINALGQEPPAATYLRG